MKRAPFSLVVVAALVAASMALAPSPQTYIGGLELPIGAPRAGTKPGVMNALPWLDASSGPFKLKLRVRSGSGFNGTSLVDSLVAGGGTLSGNYIPQGGAGTMTVLGLTRDLNWLNQFDPVEGDYNGNTLLYGYLKTGVGAAKRGDMRMLNPAKFGIRWQAQVPASPNATGSLGLMAAGGGKLYVYGGDNVWHATTDLGSFQTPAGLPDRPSLSAQLQGQDAKITVALATTGTAASGYELFRSKGNKTSYASLGKFTASQLVNYDLSLEADKWYYYFCKPENAAGLGVASYVDSVRRSTSAPPATTLLATRQLIVNTFDGALRTTAAQFVGKKITGVNFWVQWHELESSPGVYTARMDSLVSAIAYCQSLGWKAELNVWMLRRANTNGQAQDYAKFFPASDLVKYNTGAVYQWDNIVGNQSVMPSPSSKAGVNAYCSFMAEVARRTKTYADNGTLIDMMFTTGREGEYTLPFDDTPPQAPDYIDPPPLISDYSDAAKTAFQYWLAGKYGQVSSLNTAWSASFGSFGEVDFPVRPTTGEPEPAVNTEPRRDWMRWRLHTMYTLAGRIKNAVRSQSNVPLVPYLSEFGGGFQHNVGFAGTNLAYVMRDMDGVSTSAGGNFTLEPAKTSAPDIVFATLGKSKIVAIEFDSDDMSSNSLHGSSALWDRCDALYTYGKKFFDKGGQIVHLTTVGSWNWTAVTPYLTTLYNEYCAPGVNTVTPRNAVAGTSYNYSTQLTTDGNAQYTAWYAVQGNTRQVDVKQIDDFVSPGQAPPPSTPSSWKLENLATTSTQFQMRLTWNSTGGGVSPIRYLVKKNGVDQAVTQDELGLNPGGYRNWNYTFDATACYQFRVSGEMGGVTYTSDPLNLCGPTAGGGDVYALAYSNPRDYGPDYDPNAKFGSFTQPGGTDSKVRLVNESEQYWAYPGFQANSVGHASIPKPARTGQAFEGSNGFANVGGNNSGFYAGTGVLVWRESFSGAGDWALHPDNPDQMSEAELDLAVNESWTYSEDFRADIEIPDPTPTQQSDGYYMKNYVNAFGTGLIRRGKQRGQNVYFYGGKLYHLAPFATTPQGGVKQYDDPLAVQQYNLFGAGKANGWWSIKDPQGQSMMDLNDFPYAADLQGWDAFHTAFRFDGVDLGGQQYPNTDLLKATVAATGVNSVTTNRPTRYRYTRQTGTCGSGSTNFLFTLEDENGNKVPNWSADALIPATLKDPRQEGQLPLERRVYFAVDYNDNSPGAYRIAKATTYVVPGQAEAAVCIRNAAGSGAQAIPISSMDLQTECDHALLLAWAQAEATHLHGPGKTAYFNTSPTPHSSNQTGWITSGKYPDWYLPRLVSLLFNEQASNWQWHVSNTGYAFAPFGMGQDEVAAMLKLVKARETFVGAGVKNPDYSVTIGGTEYWTNRNAYVPSGGDATRYDAFLIRSLSAGTGGTGDFQDIDAQRIAYVNPRPAITVTQKGRDVMIEGNVIGRPTTPTTTYTYTVKVRDFDNPSNVKTFSLTYTGKNTLRVVKSMD